MNNQHHLWMQRVVDQLPPEERCLFSDRQLVALQRAALSMPKAKHVINIRWSVPLIGRGFYFVCLAGKEKRSQNRLRTEQTFQILPRVVVILGILMGCATIMGLTYGQRRLAIVRQREAASLEKTEKIIHPASVPFKPTQAQCERSHREWQENECIDEEYNHTF